MIFKSIHLIAAFLYVSIFFYQSAGAHSGGLDAKGGHYNRKTGEYHYHRGDGAVRTKSSENTSMKKERKEKTQKAIKSKKKKGEL